MQSSRLPCSAPRPRSPRCWAPHGSPHACRTAEHTAWLDAAAVHLDRADELAQQAEGINAQVTGLYETNRSELATEQPIRDQAALKRSAVTGMRWGMQRDADALHERITERAVQIQALREQAGQLHGRAHEMREQAKQLLARGRDHADYRPLPVQLAERRTELPALAARQDERDRRQHERLLQDAARNHVQADKLDQAATGLRAEAALRKTLTPEQAAAEAAGRTRAAQQARQHAAERTAQAGPRPARPPVRAAGPGPARPEPRSVGLRSVPLRRSAASSNSVHPIGGTSCHCRGYAHNSYWRQPDSQPLTKSANTGRGSPYK